MHLNNILSTLVILLPLPLTLSSPLTARNGDSSLTPEDTNEALTSEGALSPDNTADILGELDISGLALGRAGEIPNPAGGYGGYGAGRNAWGYHGYSYESNPWAAAASPAVTPEVAPKTEWWEGAAPDSNAQVSATSAAAPPPRPYDSPTVAGVYSPAKPTGWSAPSVAPAGSRPSRSTSSWTPPSNSYTDIQLLNLALDLQHLLQSFYAHLAFKYDVQAFIDVGYPAWVRNRFLQIQVFADVHVDALVSVILQAGGQAVSGGCGYNFDDKTILELTAMAELLETVAVSTYASILPLLESKVYIKIIGQLMSTHARETAWINAAVRSGSPWNTAFETSLSIDLVLSLISSFAIPGTCPASNSRLLPLPISASASAQLTLPGALTAGLSASVSVSLFNPLISASIDLGNLYVAFMVGADIYYQPLLNVGCARSRSQCAGSVVVPLELSATGYVFVTVVQAQVGVDIASVSIDAQVVVAGPALIEFRFDSTGASVQVGAEVDASLGLQVVA